MKTFQDFKKALEQDASLKQELIAFLAGKKAESREAEFCGTAEFAAGRGYSFTPEEMSLDTIENRELTDEEVERVAGGDWCWVDYSCIGIAHYDGCDVVMNQAKEKEVQPEYVTTYICHNMAPNCRYSDTRDGDWLGKGNRQCPKCGQWTLQPEYVKHK